MKTKIVGVYLLWWSSSSVVQASVALHAPRNLGPSTSAHTTSVQWLDAHGAWSIFGPREALAPTPEPVPVPVPTLTPPASASEPAMGDIPILISIISDSPSSSSGPSSPPPSNTSTMTSPTSTLSISSSTSISTPSSPSPAPSSSSLTRAFSPPKLTLTTFLPAIGTIGLILILLSAWFLYGCCTRHPRRGIHGKGWDLDRDGEALVCGPPYRSGSFEGAGAGGAPIWGWRCRFIGMLKEVVVGMNTTTRATGNTNPTQRKKKCTSSILASTDQN
ncbi:hypothetical protein CPB84DRAFT_1006534 [Gymnopilus junonius]|uniref:Uncharacterized protein n=1 Tax=Gymnopilus junonius TaxID=109634 RepID=A0A9P5NP25_GYMJU|nr:hypothetical protein CPB84DRAFT_1006534 [Gymnopilus junonius]